MPVAKAQFDVTDLVAGVLTGMRQGAGGYLPEVHVFADAEQTRRLRWLFDVESEFRGDVVVHDPLAEGPHQAAPLSTASTAASLAQPWLAWIVRALDGASIDVMHLIGHGYLSTAGHGAFACAEAPDQNFDRSTARFIWPQQLATLLTSTGAWGAVFTAAPSNYSAPALRLLASRIAALRAAAAAFHDVDRLSPFHGLDAIYRLLLASPAEPPSSTEGLSLTMHP
ncbi:MAG: hypothetical protein LC797_23690, partial [Chloroflexi bacterium]|nr:hypothetical protein [Chloroflexota bacterium]